MLTSRRIVRLVGIMLFCAAVATGCQWVARASVGPGGAVSNGNSSRVALSADGRFAVFLSVASNLTSDAAGVGFQVYRRDLTTGLTEMVSKERGCGGSCVGPNLSSAFPDMSADGRYVVFESTATNLVAGDSDTNGVSDIFVVDMDLDTIFRIKGFAGAELTSEARRPQVAHRPPQEGIAALWVVFDTDQAILANDTNGTSDVYRYILSLFAGLVLQSESELTGNSGNGPSSHGVISDDGGTVAFRSEATDLTADGHRFVWKIDDSGLHPQVSAAGMLLTTDANPRSVSADGDTVGLWLATTVADSGSLVLVASPTHTPTVWLDHTDVAVDASGTRVVRLGSDGIARLTDLADAAFPVPDEVVSTDLLGDVTSSAVLDVDLSSDGRTAAFSTPDSLEAGDTNVWNDVYVRMVPAVDITAVAPSVVPVDVESVITITGTGFYDNAMQVSINGATVNSWSVLDGYTITAKVVPNKTGARTVTTLLRNPAIGQALASDNCVGCLTVTP